MVSRKRGRKQKQQRLTFEPVAEATAAGSSTSGSPLVKGLSPARVSFSSPSGKEGQGSPSGSSRLAKPVEMARTRKSKKQQQQQQTLEMALGK